MSRVFYVPQKPLTFNQAVNRIAAATGSIRHASEAHHADYNGHRNHLSWNDYREYYVGEYFWAGRNVFVRNEDFQIALEASLQEFDRQGAGATLVVFPKPEDVEYAVAHPRLVERIEGEEPEKDPDAWRFQEIVHAIRAERQFGIPHLKHLEESSNLEEYKQRIDAEFAKRRKADEGNFH